MRLAAYLCKYGEAAVNEAGIAVLKYPGLWITTFGETKMIKAYLHNHYPGAQEKQNDR